MKTAFVTTYDASEVRHWSGTGYFIARALREAGLELELCGPLSVDPLLRVLLKAKGLWFNRIRRRRYFRTHDALIARRFAAVVDAWLARRPGIELIFSPGAVPVAFLRDPRPLAMWSDATHACLFDYYSEYSGLCTSTRRDGHRIEQAALDRAAAALFCSDWAAASARDDYGMPLGRAHVVPFGANVEDPPSRADAAEFIRERPADRCRLLFAGVDWQRKGGPLAVEVAAGLEASGIPTELTIVGCDPFRAEAPPPFVRVEGFLSKSSPAGLRRLRTLFSESHFLIVPSLAECYGLVYCEANCFGTPALARRTGGIPTIIEDGVNGRLFEGSAGADAYVRAIGALFRDFPRYHGMAEAARRAFEERLNWKVAGREAARILRACPALNPWPHD